MPYKVYVFCSVCGGPAWFVDFEDELALTIDSCHPSGITIIKILYEETEKEHVDIIPDPPVPKIYDSEDIPSYK
jgi:hypothetical protein